MVALTWETVAGYVLGIRLGHASSLSPFPDSSFHTGNHTGPLSEYDILGDGIGPTEGSLVIRHEFNIHWYNAFALFPFEDDIMREDGQTSGHLYHVVIEPTKPGKDHGNTPYQNNNFSILLDNK